MDEYERQQRFLRWWWDVGSGIAPVPGEDREAHAQRVARAAWHDAFVVADQREAADGR